MESKKRFAEYAASRVKSVKEYPLIQRKISCKSDILAACKDVYSSGIIFPQGGAAAKRLGTPNIDQILSDSAEKLFNYFSENKDEDISMDCFDLFHNNLCYDFLTSINNARRSVAYVDISYGSAQKFVNMVYKYLACYSDCSQYEKCFKWCHMPVDTVILKWLKDTYEIPTIQYYIYVNKKGKASLSASYKKKAWTKLDETLYKELLTKIREKVSNDSQYAGKTLIDTEFSIWK